MNALPTINSNINCIEENNKNNPIIGIFIDKKYNNENKFMCLDCIFDKHNGHIGIKSKEIEEIINMNLKEIDIKYPFRLKTKFEIILEIIN